MSRFYYLDVSLEFEPFSETEEVPPASFKSLIGNSFQFLFGEVGLAQSSSVDVLKYNPAERRASLRCPRDIYVKLRAALTFTSTFSSKPCYFNIHKASPLLLSLLANSREFNHN